MIVFPSAEKLDVFANDSGEVELVQDDALGGDSSVIVIPLTHVNAVIRALRAARIDLEQGE